MEDAFVESAASRKEARDEQAASRKQAREVHQEEQNRRVALLIAG